MDDIERKGIIAQLINMNNILKKIQELETGILLELCLLNVLSRRITYVSSGDPKVNINELEEEIIKGIAYMKVLFNKTERMSKNPELILIEDENKDGNK